MACQHLLMQPQAQRDSLGRQPEAAWRCRIGPRTAPLLNPAAAATLIALLSASPSPAADPPGPGVTAEPGAVTDLPHLRKQGTATQLIVDGKPFVMLAGELTNSTSSSLKYMEPIWDKLATLHLNTVLAPVSWEMLEPEEGRFEFRLVQDLIAAARIARLKLVFLWFGSWKNSISSYAPAWVRKDVDRFPRVQRPDGTNVGVLSPFSDAVCEADSTAFAALLRTIREIDGQGRRTVLMVQVQNEVGLLGLSRDFSPLAKEAFAKAVPDRLLGYMNARRETLAPEFRKLWESAGFTTNGTWEEVFGKGVLTDEIFMAWHYARFIDRVAAAGRSEYGLPMFVNAWLVQHEGQKPGDYPSGGPVAKMLDVYRAAAPQIDVVAPDIYLPTFKEVSREYARAGNPLLIPEVSRGPEAAGRAFWAIAELDAICFAPYGIESVEPDHPLGKAYETLECLMPLIVENQGTGRMVGILEDRDSNGSGDPKGYSVDLGDFRAYLGFNVPGKKPEDRGYGLMIALAQDTFLLAGLGFGVHFGAKPGGPSANGDRRAVGARVPLWPMGPAPTAQRR